MKRWLAATVGLFAMAGSASADKALDDAVAKTTSRDYQVRQEGVREIQAWMERLERRFTETQSLSKRDLQAELKALQTEVEATRPHRGLLASAEDLGEVVEVIADTRHETAREFLRKRFDDTSGDIPVRWTWEESLPTVCGNGREWGEANRYIVSHCLEAARELVADPRFENRGTILKALAELKHPKDRETAMRFTRASNPSLRASAVWALAEYPVETWWKRVTALANDRDPEVRYSVASVLKSVERVRSVPTLTRLLADPYQIVAEAAHFSLGRLGDKSPALERAYLRVFARHPNWDFVREGLETQATKESIEPLHAHWRSKGTNWYFVPSLLKPLDSRLARKLLLDTARSVDPQARWIAISGMDELTGEDTDAAILTALLDKDYQVVSSALRSVEARKLQHAIPILREILQRRGYPHLDEVKRVQNLLLETPERRGK